ncbi:MAG: Nif3-like dinuclear metal center hexameric protein [Cellulosilyticaceae bacterium]
MYTIADLLVDCDRFAPEMLAESYDNVGLLVGDRNASVEKILCALDLTDEVITEAIELGAKCIITHHPFIFKALKSINSDNFQGRMLRRLIKADLNLIAMHTNLDIAKGGINDYLCEKLNINVKGSLQDIKKIPMYKVEMDFKQIDIEKIKELLNKWNISVVKTHILEGSGEIRMSYIIRVDLFDKFIDMLKKHCNYEFIKNQGFKIEQFDEKQGIGRFGDISSIPFEDFIGQIKKVFNVKCVRVINSCKKNVTSVAVCSGSGSEFIQKASYLADVYITADIKFHEAQEALQNGLTVVDVGHYASENIALPIIKEYLNQFIESSNIYISKVNGEVFEYH